MSFPGILQAEGTYVPRGTGRRCGAIRPLVAESSCEIHSLGKKQLRAVHTPSTGSEDRGVDTRLPRDPNVESSACRPGGGRGQDARRQLCSCADGSASTRSKSSSGNSAATSAVVGSIA